MLAYVGGSNRLRQKGFRNRHPYVGGMLAVMLALRSIALQGIWRILALCWRFGGL